MISCSAQIRGCIRNCHFHYGASVLSFFWLPGLLTGSYVFAGLFLEEKTGFDLGCCLCFVFGIIFGPIVFVPFGHPYQSSHQYR